MTTNFKIPCPSCHASLRVPYEFINRRINCVRCKHPFRAQAKIEELLPAAAPQAAALNQIAQLDAELQEARLAMAQRDQQIVSLRRAAEELETRYRQEVAERQQALAAARSEVMELHERVAALPLLQADQARLSGELASLTADHSGAKTELQRKCEQVNELERQVQSLHSTAAEADAAHCSEIDRLGAQVKELQERATLQSDTAGQFTQLDAELQEARLATAQRDQQIEHLRRAAEEADTRYRKEHEERQQALAAARSEVAELHERIAELPVLQADQARLSGKLASLSADHGGAKTELQRKCEQVAELERQVQSLRSLADDADAAQRERIAQLETELLQAQSAAAQGQQQIQELRRAAEEAEAHYRRSTEERQQALAALRREVLELREHVAEMPVLQAESERLIGELAGVTSDHADAVEDLEQTQQRLADLEQQIQTLHRAVGEADVSHQSHRNEIERLREQVKELEARAEMVAPMEAELREARATVSRLESKLAAAPAFAGMEEFEAIEAERDQLAEQLRTLQAELDRLPDRTNAQFQVALDAIFSGVNQLPKPQIGSEKRAESMTAMRKQLAQERAALQNELTKLRQENVRMRQWLTQCGISLG